VLRTWDLPATLTNISTSVTIADPVYIEYSGVRSVEMSVTPLFPAGSFDFQPLTPNGSTIEILVSNRCFTDKDAKIPKKLTLDDVECRYYENGFKIVQIDKDFAFNYQMLHPTTLAALSKFLPQDPETGKPRFPVPESDLLSVFSAFPICIDDLESKLEKLLEELGLRREKEMGEDFGRRLLSGILALVMTGAGTGSGSDCLGSSGLTRFVNMDPFIPPPGPTPKASSIRSPGSLSTSPGTLASSTLGNPPQVVRNRTSTAAARSRGRVSGAAAPAQAGPAAGAADKLQSVPPPRKS
jgi:hypothetical protein